MIDCHAHLTDKSFYSDLNSVLERAQDVGVERVICVVEDMGDVDRALEIGRQNVMVSLCFGVHPVRVNMKETLEMCAFISEHNEEIVGIGEVGLDYWITREESEREVQRECLAEFVGVSKQFKLPLNVHSRSAGHYTIDLLCELGAEKVLMHAFGGKAKYALAGIEAGFKFSIPPSIVRSQQKQKLVKALPLEDLLLETDSPVLGPERDERNEPGNVKISAQCIAEIKGCAVQEVIEITTENAKALFDL
jgi:TatD DNase family protein